MRIRRSLALLLPIAAMGASVLVFNCSSDDESPVVVIKDCNTANLKKESVQGQTVAVFVDTAAATQTQALALEKKFQDACNAINTELGNPVGADLKTSCNPIAVRVAAVLAKVPDGGSTTWAKLVPAGSCSTDANAEAACVATCSGGVACDVAAKCPAGSLSGSCAGNCATTCETKGSTSCTGACSGACAIREAGAPCVTGECVGKCTAKKWLGSCDSPCDLNFLGACDATCTGTCDDVPINVAPVDAGSDGEAGAVDAGPVDASAPTNSPGNCKGVCRGKCGGAGTGSCESVCKGNFSGGTCTGGGAVCTGTCRGNLVGCGEGTCEGTCTTNANGGACAGNCKGACSTPPTNVACNTGLGCEANPVCLGTCRVKKALTAKCTVADVALLVVGDAKLYAALLSKGKGLIAAQLEFNALNNAFPSMQTFSAADFAALGANSDQARACVTNASAVITAITTSLNNSKGASLVLTGKSF